MNPITNETINIPFTGWEPHNAMRLFHHLNKNTFKSDVIIIGREPITTTEVALYGNIIGTTWNKYDRGIIFQTNEGAKFKAGGTNTTSSIAQTVTIFNNVPLKLIPPLLDFSEINYFLTKDVEFDVELLNRIEITLRCVKLPYEILYTSFNHNKEIFPHIEKIWVEFDLNYAKKISDFNWDQLLKKISKTKIKDEILVLCRILSLLHSEYSLELLIDKYLNGCEEIKNEVALSLRSKEEILQKLKLEKPNYAEKVINTISSFLKNETNTETKVYLCENLGYYSTHDSVKTLIDLLKNDKDEHVRWSSGVALARSGEISLTFNPLTDAVLTDTSVNVRRSILLGLGRILSKFKVETQLQNIFTDDILKLENKLDEFLTNSKNISIQTYTVYACGEISSKKEYFLKIIIPLLDTKTPFSIRANAALAISKILRDTKISRKMRLLIIRFLKDNLLITRPITYPETAYFDWFLEYSGELLVKLESRELAARYYILASGSSESTSWRSTYYKGIAGYELAEHWLDKMDYSKALGSLENSIHLFKSLEDLSDTEIYSDKMRIGIDFRINMAEARKSIILGLSHWRNPIANIRTNHDFNNHMNESYRRYMQILRSELDTSTKEHQEKRLTPVELDTVRALMSFVTLSMKIEKLSLAIEEKNNDILSILGIVEVKIEEMLTLTKETNSLTLLNTSKKMKKLIKETYIALNTNELRSNGAVIGIFISKIKQIFTCGLPTPAIECKLIGPGRVNVSINLNDSISGTGEINNPYTFPSNKTLIFRVSVDVIQRAKNEQLIFRSIETSGYYKEHSEAIHVHEGTYDLRCSYNPLPASTEALRFQFILEFRNSGCSDPVYNKAIWVAVYNPNKEPILEDETKKQMLISIKRKIENLIKDKNRLMELNSNQNSLKIKLQLGKVTEEIEKARKEEDNLIY